MTPNSMIRAAMRAATIIAAGENPTAEELDDCLETLNAMLKSWSTRRLLVYFTTWENFTLVAGTASYAIGSGATWNTARPTRIQGAFVRDSNGMDYPVDIIGSDRYRRLGLKSNSARPDKLWYNPTFPTGTVYLYATPAAAEALHLWSLKPLTTFTSLTTTIEMPGEYEEAIKYSLAVRLAPEFGKSVSAELALLLENAMAPILAQNAAAQVEPIYAEPAVAQGGGRYDINQG